MRPFPFHQRKIKVLEYSMLDKKLDKKNFTAHLWLKNPPSRPTSSTTPRSKPNLTPYLGREETNLSLPLTAKEKTLKKFLIPTWTGASLFSKSANLIKKIQEQLWQDALSQLAKLDSPNSTLKKAALSEYHYFIKKFKNASPTWENQSDFWKLLQQKKPSSQYHLKEFKEYYTFKVATVYLHKIMFMINLADTLSLSLQESDLNSPNSTLNRWFQKKTSHELSCESFRQNQYSWYRPSSHLLCEIRSLSTHFKSLSTGQLMKLSTYRKLKKIDQNFNFSDHEYSHALSHRDFGLFINTLLIFFPLWQEQDKFTYPYLNPTKQSFPKVLNTKFSGDKFHNICQSHWLAQDSNLKIFWNEIISPVFSQDLDEKCSFIKICHELNFLTFLVKFSKHQNYPTKELLCHVMKNKYHTQKQNESGQFNLFNHTTDSKKPLSYHRIILTVPHFSKNAHHQLIQKINHQKSQLVQNGHLYIFTNQNLFVPSQAHKIEQLLKDFKVEALFDFCDLKGKGEISNYLYILKKRSPLSPLTQKTESQQESILRFRWSGQLKLFGQFQYLVKELYSFFKKKNPHSTPMYSKKLQEDFYFEFYRDSLLKGRLLSSTSKENNNITHPQFLRKMIQNCVPLENFFSIHNIKNKEKLTSQFLGVDFKKKNYFSHVLVVHRQNPNLVQLELIPFSSYEEKKKEYGTVFYQFFGLVQKIPDLNEKLFQDFFESSIGIQITQISLHSREKSRTKSKLESLFVPKIFAQTRDQSDSPHLNENEPALKIFESTIEEMTTYSARQLKELMSKGLNFLREEKSSSSKAAQLELMNSLKSNFIKIKEQYDREDRQEDQETQESSEINYAHPLILKPLLKLKRLPFYPNEEIYFEFNQLREEDLDLFLKDIQQEAVSSHPHLTLYLNEKAHIKVYSDPALLSLIQYLIRSLCDQPVRSIIGNLQLPPLQDLKEILKEFHLKKQVIQEESQNLCDFMNQFFTQALAQG